MGRGRRGRQSGEVCGHPPLTSREVRPTSCEGLPATDADPFGFIREPPYEVGVYLKTLWSLGVP